MCNMTMVGQGFGALSSAMGARYAAQSRQYEIRSAALQDAAAAKNRQMALDFKSAEAGIQSLIGDLNAKMLEGTAQAVLLSGQREEQKSQINTANLKSSQRAAMAANGIDLGEGTAENVLTSTDVLGEIDTNTIKANAVRSAWGYRLQAQDVQGQADIARATQYGSAVMADADRKTSAMAWNTAERMAKSMNPNRAFGASLLSGMGSVAESWYKYSTQNPSTNVTRFDVFRANLSSDPIGSLNSIKGWT